MIGLQLIHVSKGDPVWSRQKANHNKTPKQKAFKNTHRRTVSQI